MLDRNTRAARWLLWRFVSSASLRAFLVSAVAGGRGLAGSRFADGLVERLAALLARSSFPYRVPGYSNLHAAELVSELRRASRQVRDAASARACSSAATLRVGCLGPFSGLLSFQRAFFEHHPENIELFVYDLAFDGGFARFVEPFVRAHRPIPDLADDEWARRVAATINVDRLDVLVTVYPKPRLYDVLDRIDPPAVVNICTGSEPMFHPRFTRQIYAQPQTAYRLAADRIVCEVTGRAVPSARVTSGWVLYDDRGLRGANPEPWARRRPLVVFHGSLYKLNAAPFLRTLCRLLHDDRQLEFVFMGRDTPKGILAAITHQFARENLSERVHYDGAFVPARREGGESGSEEWNRLVGHLSAARLAPNPWPIGGGSSRVEAYLAGAPTVHMALASIRDAASEGSLVDLPALTVPRATATGQTEYLGLCRQCLYHEAFANQVAADQLAIGRAVTSPQLYWEQLMTVFQSIDGLEALGAARAS